MEVRNMNMRYFLADEAAYEQARAMLNSVWGLPNPGTETALPAADTLLKVDGGRVYFSADVWMCNLAPAPDVIAAALADGSLVEISEQEGLAISSAAYPDL
jgi:hypothetical protein